MKINDWAGREAAVKTWGVLHHVSDVTLTRSISVRPAFLVHRSTDFPISPNKFSPEMTPRAQPEDMARVASHTGRSELVIGSRVSTVYANICTLGCYWVLLKKDLRMLK